MDPRALWLSATFAAAKLAIALWCGQIALSVLDRRRVTLAWQIALSAATILLSWWAMRTGGTPPWWETAWLASSLLAAAVLIDCLRRWLAWTTLSEPSTEASALDSAIGRAASGRAVSRKSAGPRASQRVHDLLAVVGLIVTSIITAQALPAQLPAASLPRVAAVAQMLTCAGLLGVALAASFELTIGATGATLLALNWRRLARLAALCLLVQLTTSAIVVIYRRDGASPAESLSPIFFALGMVIVGYIVWTIPRQIVSLAAKGRMTGQASLAVAGWLAVICLAVACGLPPAWPWVQIGIDRSTLSQPLLPSQ